MEVIEIEVVDSEHYAQLPRILPPWEEKMAFYNCDIPLPQTYLYEKEIFQPAGVLLRLKEIAFLKFILIQPGLCG